MIKVLTFGVFDYFHLGHLRLFKQCREYGDYLIVAVQEEKYIRKYKPNASILYSGEERVEILTSIKEIDKVITYKELTCETLASIDFDILALGEDHIGERFDKLCDYCAINNKRVVRLKRTKGISSSEIKIKLGEKGEK